MNNKPMSGRAWSGIALLLCLCLACLPLVGMATAGDGGGDGTESSESEAINDIVPVEGGGGEVAEQPEPPVEPVQPEPPAEPEQPEAPPEAEQPDDPAEPEEPEAPPEQEPEAPAEPEQPDAPAEPEQPDVPEETDQPDVPDETEPPIVPDETEPPEETPPPDVPDETVQPDSTEPPDMPDETEPPDVTETPNVPDETMPLPSCPPTEPPAPDALYNVLVGAPTVWMKEPAKITVRIEDVNGAGWNGVVANVALPKDMLDISAEMTASGAATVEINDNCTVTVVVTDPTGITHEFSRQVICYDRTVPKVKASIEGRVLRMKAADDLSGIAYLYVNNQRFDKLDEGGLLDVALKELDDYKEYKQFRIRCVDWAGNESEAVKLKNPLYKSGSSGSSGGGGGSVGSGGGGSSSRSTPKPTAAPTATPAPAPPTISPEQPEITIVPGTGFSQNGNSVTRDLLYDKHTNKQFIAVKTKDGNTFYMVIDYDKPIDESGENYETYFLNLVDNADLMALLKDGQLPEPEVCICTERCVAGDVNMACPVCKHSMGDCIGKEPALEPTPVPEAPPEEPKGSPAGAILIVLLLAAIGGAALWYFKFRKPDDTAKGKNAFEDYGYDDDDDEDEEYEREDAEPEAPAAERPGEDE